MIGSYPAERETDIVLHGGGTAHVRPVRADDEDQLRSFLGSLSEEARAFRFFGAGTNLDAMALLCATVDYHDSYGIVATGEGGAILGHGMYSGRARESVEVAFAISDQLVGQGVGTVLLAHLLEAASGSGFEAFHAQVLAGNARMLEMFRDSGFPDSFSASGGVVCVRGPTSLSEDAIRRFESRDQQAAAAAIHHFLRPTSIALIGASRQRGSVGGAMLHNLLDAGFTGPIYPVNSAASSVQGVRVHPSILSIPGPVDLAVIAVPADGVVDVARECGAAGVAAVVVVSGGFAETGGEGKRLQDELLEVCRRSGMRLVGPNCLGVLTTAPGIRLNATFARAMPPAGPLALMSQSGALGLAVIDQAVERGLGLASFVSAGNKADISGNDLIQFWADDPDVGIIGLYLESFGNARKFARTAPRVARIKPIVAVKSGRSRAGARAAASHTGAALAASDLTVDALFKQAGVIRADSLGELLDISSLLGTQPLPKDNRVAVVTNSGGPGLLCADALDATGMVMAEFSEEFEKLLGTLLPASSSSGNPVDMLATADADLYARVLAAFADEESVDAVIVIYTPTGLDDPAAVLAGIGRGADELAGRVPLLAVALMPRSNAGLIQTETSRTPLYGFPENAVRALSQAWQYSSWRERPHGRFPAFADTRPHEAAAVIAAALADGEAWLAPEHADALLRAYGIELIESRRAASATEVGRIAGEWGVPVTIKAVGPMLLHKTESGAVRLGLAGAAEAMGAASDLRRSLRDQGHAFDGFLVQRMAGPGTEILIGVVHDAVFGPVVVCGAGGTTAELLADTTARITPLAEADAHELVTSLRTYRLLDGWRGAPKADVPALEEMLLRVSLLVEAHPEIAELDLNPVIVSETGAVAVDVRVRIEASGAAPPWPSVTGRPPMAASRAAW